MKRLLLLLPLMLLGSIVKAEEQLWKQVRQPLDVNGEEFMAPEYIDINSTLRTSDGYIVFRSTSPLSTLEMRNGELFLNKQKRTFSGATYYAIECDLKRWVSTTWKPKFEHTWRNYTKDERAYNNDWPRNVEKLLCNKPGLRAIPHTAGKVMFLNYTKTKKWSNEVLTYDEAVKMGIIQ